MKSVIAFFLLFSSSVFAASGSGNVSNIAEIGGGSMTTFGGAINTPLSVSPAITISEGALTTSGAATYKTLVSGNASVTAQGYNGFFDTSANTSTMYSVPGGKIFLVLQMCWNHSTTTTIAITPGSAGATFTNGSATVPATTPSYWSGTVPTSNTGFYMVATGAATNSIVYGCVNVSTSFATGRFPYWVNTSGAVATITLIGKEI